MSSAGCQHLRTPAARPYRSDNLKPPQPQCPLQWQRQQPRSSSRHAAAAQRTTCRAHSYIAAAISWHYKSEVHSAEMSIQCDLPMSGGAAEPCMCALRLQTAHQFTSCMQMLPSDNIP